MAILTGVVETTRELQYGPERGTVVSGFVRGDDGRRYFLHPSDCGSYLPRRFDRVTFDPDLTGDERGPRARQVQILVDTARPDNVEYEDRTIVCSECRRPFPWLAGEQAFYAARRLHAPKKCRPCRHDVRARLGLE